MNAYWHMGLWLSIAIVCFTAGFKVESWRWEASLAESSQHALGEIKTQGNISKEATNENEKSIIAIDAAYDSMPTALSMSPISKSPAGTCTNLSKIYRLTPQQCDLEEAKANALWNWANQQAVVK